MVFASTKVTTFTIYPYFGAETLYLVKEFTFDKATGEKDKYGNEIWEDDAEKVLGIKSEGLTYLLINAVQEQQVLIDELRNELDNLKNKKNE